MRVVGDFNDWGLQGVALFLQLLESHMFPLGRRGDQMRWKLKRSGDFSVRSSYGHYGAHPLCLSFVGPYGGLRLLKAFPFCVDRNLGENPYL